MFVKQTRPLLGRSEVNRRKKGTLYGMQVQPMPRKALRWVKAAGLPDVLQGKAAPACIKMQHSNFSVSTKVRAGQRLGGTVSRSVTFGCFSS